MSRTVINNSTEASELASLANEPAVILDVTNLDLDTLVIGTETGLVVNEGGKAMATI